MASLQTVTACLVLFLWNFGAIRAAAPSRASDHGEQSTNATNSLINDGSLPQQPRNERDSILARRKTGKPEESSNTLKSLSIVVYPLRRYVRLDVQFPKRTESVSTELQAVLRKVDQLESGLKTLQAESLNAKKNEDHSLGSGKVNQARPGDLPWTDCSDVLKSGRNVSGVYRINPLPHDVKAFPVYCNMDTHGGGWTVFQSRSNGKINFYQDWKHYKEGFGDIDDEYWLGLERVHRMTNSKHYELLIELKDFEDSTRFGIWNRFVLGSEAQGYNIAELGTYKGDAGDSFTPQGNSKFSTWDVDNDAHETHCARVYTGPWWHRACFESNLNGLYVRGADYTIFANGIIWKAWRDFYYSLKESRMSIRPRSVADS